MLAVAKQRTLVQTEWIGHHRRVENLVRGHYLIEIGFGVINSVVAVFNRYRRNILPVDIVRVAVPLKALGVETGDRRPDWCLKLRVEQ